MATLKRVWTALNQQTLPQDQWEYVLVDNASEPELSRRFSVSWHPAGRCVKEERMGLTWARLRGISEARGEILLFVDDDCILNPDYLAHALSIFQRNDFMGAVGGYGQAEYMRPPPAWMNATFRRFHLDMEIPTSENKLLYARVRKLGPWVPVGAGMAIRKPFADLYAKAIANDPVALGLDRVGSMLTGGGDTDMGMFVMDAGAAIGNSADLHFTHVVPPFRLELKYMVRLLYMSQYSVAQLLVHRGWEMPLPARAPTLKQKLRKVCGIRRVCSAEDYCWQAFTKGYADGLAGVSPDPRFTSSQLQPQAE